MSCLTRIAKPETFLCTCLGSALCFRHRRNNSWLCGSCAWRRRRLKKIFIIKVQFECQCRCRSRWRFRRRCRCFWRCTYLRRRRRRCFWRCSYLRRRRYHGFWRGFSYSSHRQLDRESILVVRSNSTLFPKHAQLRVNSATEKQKRNIRCQH